MNLKQAITGAAALACMTTAAHAQSAGSFYVTAGWFHLAPQSSSDPLKETNVRGLARQYHRSQHRRQDQLQ